MTKQCYRFLLDGGIRSFFNNIIWKIKVPEKVKYFAYFSFQDKILTKANLTKWGWMSKDSCTLCNSSLETADHLFLQHTFSRLVWSSLQHTLGHKELSQNQFLLWNAWRVEEPMRSNQQEVDILRLSGLWILWEK